MSQVKMCATEVQKQIAPALLLEQEVTRQPEQVSAQQVLPQVAYRRTQVNRNGLMPDDILALQRTVGNLKVQRMVAQRMSNADDRQPQKIPEKKPGIMAQTKPAVGTPNSVRKHGVDHLSNMMIPLARLPFTAEQTRPTILVSTPIQPQMQENPKIPPELQTSVDITKLNWMQLKQRLNLIEQTLMLLNRSTPDTERLKQEAKEISDALEQIRQTKCPNAIDADQIVVDHRVDPSEINKPGDKVTFTVTFACIVRYGGYSKLVASDNSVFSRQTFGPKNQLIREWDGKRLFTNIGTYMVGDGIYYHELEKVKYAVKGKTDLFASGPNLKSPPVRVNVRSFPGPGGPQDHYTPSNVDALAAIIQSEIGVGNDDEQKAIAWCVRNQMVRLGTASVETVRDHFQDKHNQAATSETKAIAEEILKKPMSDDITGGAIKWFSPRSMPQAGGSCAGFNCKGGLEDMTNNSGNKVTVYTPDFHKSMKYISVAGVREWFLRVYAL